MTTTASVPDDVLQDFRTKIRGEVLLSGDAGSEQVRGPFNAMHESRPDVAVRCTGTADVVDAVNFAREQGLSITVRGGGHSIAGLSSPNGGLLVDLSLMNGVQIDPDRKLAHVQGGALWGDVDREAQAFGLVTPGGVVSDTGVAGLTLGGGYGWVRRKYGLSCDNVVEAQVVCADGQVRTASAESNPDLYWALRGGGGNFGIVTGFTFRMHPLNPVIAFAGVFYAVEDAPAILRGWRDYVNSAPEEVTSIAVSFTFPADPHLPPPVHNRPCLVLGGVYAGDLEEGLEVLKPLGTLGTPIVDLSGPAPFTFVQSTFDALFQRGQYRSYWKSQSLDELSDGAIDTFAALALDRPKPLFIVNIWPMGGAISRVGPEETAFAERSSPFMMSVDGNWEEPEFDAEGVAWVRSAWSRIGEFGNGATYLNFTGLADEAVDTGVESALGRNLRRLAEVKATYDPDNFFRRNNNIAPGR